MASTVEVYEVVNGGRTRVGAGLVLSGLWSAVCVMRSGRKTLLVKYSDAPFEGSDIRNFTYEYEAAKVAPPVIDTPNLGDTVETSVTIGGTGLGTAYVQAYQDGTSKLLGASVVGYVGEEQGPFPDRWRMQISNLSPGTFTITAMQKFILVDSPRGMSLTLRVRPPKLPLITVAYPNETTVRLSGTAYTGAGSDTKVHIHYKGDNPGPFPDVSVLANGTWTKDITGLLPSNTQYAFDVQQSVFDGINGRIRNTGYTEALVTVITPKPTLNTPTLIGQIPTFGGRRNVWEGNRAGGIQIQLNDQTHALLPDLQGTTTSWNITATDKIAPGSYTVRARQGINSRWSELTTPAVPLIIKPDPPELSSPAAGVETPQNVEFRGKTWPNAQVVVRFKNGDPIKTVSSNVTTGEWSFNYTLPLGRVEVEVLSTFGGQTSGVKSQSFPVKTPPPTITSPTASNNEVPPKPVIKGTGIAGCYVYVYSSNTDAQLGSAQVGSDKNWTVTLDEQILGDLRIYTKQVFNTTYASNPTDPLLIKVVVPSPVIEQPGNNTRPARTFTVSGKDGWLGGVIDLKFNGQLSTYKDIQVQNDGSWQVEVAAAVGSLAIEAIQRYKGVPSGASTSRTVTVVPAVPVIDTPRNLEAVGHTTLKISGFGYPGDTVYVQRTGRSWTFDPVSVKTDGTWSASLVHNMQAGDGIKAFARAGAGLDSVPSSTITFLLLKPAPKINQPAEGDWVTAKPQYSGEATPNATITVASWFNTDNLLAPSTRAGANGLWTVMGNKDLPVGGAWVVVRQTLPDGTASEWAESGRFNVE
nr:hypothetical protein [Pseudomonas caspiana]